MAANFTFWISGRRQTGRGGASVRARLALLLLCVAPTGCVPSQSGGDSPAIKKISTSSEGLAASRDVAFADVARERGLDYSWPKQPRPMRATEAFGAGCAAFDGDNDGFQDLLLVADPHPILYRNTGTGRFSDVTAESGLSQAAGDWTGCAIGDYDGDGLLDILLTGIHELALFQNRGGLKFSLVTEQAGLDPTNHGHWGASAGFMDLDGDQRLDLVILNYVVFGPHVKQYCEQHPGMPTGCHPREYTPERGEIWHNVGQGKFEMIPDAAGMKQTSGVGLVLAFTDIDADGRLDFYIGNDGTPAELLHNQGNMRFENIGVVAGLDKDAKGSNLAAMGADWGDYNRDGRLDLVVTNFQDSCFVVYQAYSDCSYLDVSAPTGVAQATRDRLGFGAKWVDFDNDGWPDIFFVNGHVYDNVDKLSQNSVSLAQPILLMRNQRGEHFVDATGEMKADVQRPILGRGSATLDFNNDGRMDLLAVDFEGPVMLLENQSSSPHHWITLDLRSAAPNVFAYGARAAAKTEGQLWVAEVSPASSYLSSSDPRIHWGLGAVTELSELTIRWPSGKTQQLKNVRADQILKIEEPRE